MVVFDVVDPSFLRRGCVGRGVSLPDLVDLWAVSLMARLLKPTTQRRPDFFCSRCGLQFVKGDLVIATKSVKDGVVNFHKDCIVWRHDPDEIDRPSIVSGHLSSTDWKDLFPSNRGRPRG